ncbi:MAG TPA: hypothetical protein VKG44_05630 [Candidatus Baltobacteraceae bacterium]|nr:hypothetical protein [Candidatus Baltobacteraceae bacterium]
MRRLIAILSLGFLLAPALASADDSANAPSPQMRATMQQAHAQMTQLHQQYRTQMLASLTPAHRAALANIIGQLAVAPNPNPAAAAREIDALLSQSEGQAILRNHQAYRAQAQTLMTQVRAQIESSMSADEKAQMEARHTQMEQQHPGGAQAMKGSSTDPGTILLRSLSPEGGHMHGAPGLAH